MSEHPIRLSFAIMAVRSRTAHVQALQGRIERQIAVASMLHGVRAHPTVHVAWADTGVGPWQNWQRAWLAGRPDVSTHRVVLQDDVKVCDDFPATMAAIAAARPASFVSGFLPRKSVDRAVRQGVRWVSCRRFLWAQCVMLPTELGDEMLRWIETSEGQESASDWRHHDDVRMGAFLQSRKLPAWVPVPNVVEHVGDAIGGSTLGHNGPAARRRARSWIGETNDGRMVNWHDLAFVRD